MILIKQLYKYTTNQNPFFIKYLNRFGIVSESIEYIFYLQTGVNSYTHTQNERREKRRTS